MSPHDDAATRAAPSRYDAVLRVRAVTLEVTEGADAGRTARVDRPNFVVGSGEGADMRLFDSTVSREHLRLWLVEPGVRLRDEGSKNGTWLGGVRIAEATLTGDTALLVGTTKMVVRLESGPLDLPLSTSGRFGAAIGDSPAMRHVFALLERAAPSNVNVLLEGESGVGKEVLARAVHVCSARAEGPFVAVDCGALPAGLIESELFGHERGAFTGAVAERVGVFEQAIGGTLFLDEIGELPIDLQPKLLRVLEQREVRPLGSRAVRPVDVRVLAATNRRLTEAVDESEFRRDLFYRLAVARVVIPPLRDRPEDILPLARALLRRTVGDEQANLPEDFLAMLQAYSWPGNVRELRNVIERYALLGVRDAALLFDGVAPGVGGQGPELSALPYQEARKLALQRFERDYLPGVLARAGGVVAQAAQLAGVARPSFYRMLSRVRSDDDGNDS